MRNPETYWLVEPEYLMATTEKPFNGTTQLLDDRPLHWSNAKVGLGPTPAIVPALTPEFCTMNAQSPCGIVTGRPPGETTVPGTLGKQGVGPGTIEMTGMEAVVWN